MDEWDVLKAHARAQCVTVKDRLWCEVALALGEVVRRIAVRGEATPPMVRRAWYGVQPRKAQDLADALARAERKAAKAAMRAAREERKRMRRDAAHVDSSLWWRRHDLLRAVDRLAYAKRTGFAWKVFDARGDAREAELRYAIACAEAGAVPGGRVH